MKKLQKLKLNEMQDRNAISIEEQMQLKGGGDPNSWDSWDDIPDDATFIHAADNTYVATGSSLYEFATGSSESTWMVSEPDVMTSGSSSYYSKQSLVEWYDNKVEENPSWDPFPKTSMGHTIMEYISR